VIALSAMCRFTQVLAPISTNGDIIEVNKIVTRRGGLNCDPLKINLQLKINSQVVYLEKLS